MSEEEKTRTEEVRDYKDNIEEIQKEKDEIKKMAQESIQDSKAICVDMDELDDTLRSPRGSGLAITQSKPRGPFLLLKFLEILERTCNKRQAIGKG